MNTHDPAFRRAFRRGVKLYGADAAFMVVQDGAAFFPIPYRPGMCIAPENVLYWNPDGKRWRRFDPSKIKVKQEAKNE